MQVTKCDICGKVHEEGPEFKVGLLDSQHDPVTLDLCSKELTEPVLSLLLSRQKELLDGAARLIYRGQSRPPTDLVAEEGHREVPGTP